MSTHDASAHAATKDSNVLREAFWPVFDRLWTAATVAVERPDAREAQADGDKAGASLMCIYKVHTAVLTDVRL